LLIVEVLLAIVGVLAFFLFRRDQDERRPFKSRTARALALLLVVVTFLTLLGRHLDLQHLLHARKTPKTTAPTPPLVGGNAKQHHPAPPRHVHLRWDELAVALALLLGLGVLAVATRRRLGPPTWGRQRAPEALAAALDESLDDLRADPDLRRAIIAAYARMETALGAAGLPRRPAEAPLEYLERALIALDTSAAAVRRLTDLFEWARFSQHEPEPSMRDEAVDALTAVRDELRASELTAA
jgi:hypothetical protein